MYPIYYNIPSDLTDALSENTPIVLDVYIDNILTSYYSVINHPVKGLKLPAEDDMHLIEYMVNSRGYPLFENLFKFANSLSLENSNDIIVILNTMLTYHELLRLNLFDNLVRRLRCLLITYPNVVIAISNNIHLHNYSELHGNYNNLFIQNVELVKELRLALNTSRIGTTIDIQQFLITKNFIKINSNTKSFKLKDLFSANKQYALLVELGNVKPLNTDGYYTPMSDELLYKVLKQHDLQVPNVPISLNIDCSEFDDVIFEIDNYYSKGESL